MPHIELFVKLKIPDTTAITTFHTLQKMGYSELKKLTRQDYYVFDVSGNVDKFSKKIGTVDVLVNANKHSYSININNNKINKKTENNPHIIHTLVQSIENDCDGLLHTLQNRLGLKEIKKMQKGILWTLEFENWASRERAEKIAKELLANENYQKFRLF